MNEVTNKIYVGNSCGTDPTCISNPNGNGNTIGTITAVDGVTLATSAVSAGKGTTGMAVNPVANEIYMTNSTDNTVTFVNGVTLDTTTLAVGTSPADAEVDPGHLQNLHHQQRRQHAYHHRRNIAWGRPASASAADLLRLWWTP